jgi:hypothetical protein
MHNAYIQQRRTGRLSANPTFTVPRREPLQCIQVTSDLTALNKRMRRISGRKFFEERVFTS